MELAGKGDLKLPFVIGTYHFICTHDSHCSSGQNVSVTVGSSSSGTNTTPGGSGAAYLAATSRVLLISIAIITSFSLWI